MAPDTRRLEELGLNSSTPPGQLLYDGWLLRMLPGKAKRARCVNAMYPSTLPLDTKIAHCERLYRSTGVPMIFRITPFSQPPELDEDLERRGFFRFETTAVEYAEINPAYFTAATGRVLDLPSWIDAVGDLRDSPPEHRTAHRARLEGSPLALRAVAVEEEGRIAATGLTIVEDDCAGVFDIVTREDSRRRGHARAVLATLLQTAWDMGVRHAYLQVNAENDSARKLYRQFGFHERYQYWYRGRPGEQR
ncbi:MAG TPA: GNAT family N-acetyltransferase [Usitatibacter sp.]|nr:GNAT family N-acetyltransferase [Usitatibacter sp.]